MAKSTHQKQLERARARRASERAERRRATTVVVSVVAGLVVLAVALAGALLMRGDDEADVADLEAFDQGDEVEDAAESAPEDGGTTASDDATSATATVDGVEPCPVASGSLPTPTTTPYGEMPAADLGGATSVTATLRTTCGDIVLELDADGAPTTVANFVGLATDGYYAGVGFHRVIDDFMIQGGDPTGTGSGCLDDACDQRLPGYTFADELGPAEDVVAAAGGYPRGTLAMANAGPDTNGSQFFIVQREEPYPLPPAYAVFGEVTQGMDVVDRIALGPAGGETGDQAIDPVIILGVDVES